MKRFALVYDRYPIDGSDLLSSGDAPNLAAIRLYDCQGSNRLAVKAVELCRE